jgi:hypothetical protein
MDYPQYEDVSGPSCEMAINDLIQEYKERVEKFQRKTSLQLSKQLETCGKIN